MVFLATTEEVELVEVQLVEVWLLVVVEKSIVRGEGSEISDEGFLSRVLTGLQQVCYGFVFKQSSPGLWF